jgi:hypothetical protein
MQDATAGIATRGISRSPKVAICEDTIAREWLVLSMRMSLAENERVDDRAGADQGEGGVKALT